MILEIVIPGRPVSGNHAKTSTNHRTKASREYDARIAVIATAAVLVSGWKIPDYVSVDVTIYNSRADRDNVLKEVDDPLEGIVYVRDGRILDGFTKRLKDKLGPRVVMHITAVDGAAYGFEKPASAEFLEARREARRRTALVKSLDTALVPVSDRRSVDELKSGDVVPFNLIQDVLKKGRRH